MEDVNAALKNKKERSKGLNKGTETGSMDDDEGGVGRRIVYDCLR